MTDHKPLSEGEMRNARDDELRCIDADRYSDAMDSAVNAYAMAGYFQRTEGRDRGNGEDIIREKLAHAIMTYIKEYPESGLVRLARPPAPCRDGTTVGAQPAAQQIPTATPKPLDGEAVDEKTLRAILADEIKERGGPQDYIAMLDNRWMEIDSELPPELSAALAAMKRVAFLSLPAQTCRPSGGEDVTELLADTFSRGRDAGLEAAVQFLIDYGNLNNTGTWAAIRGLKRAAP